LVEVLGIFKHWKKKVREETVFKHMRLQLTAVHARHLGGIPGGEVAVEGSGPKKHWKKECERRNSFQTSLQLTVRHVRHCGGLPGGEVLVEGTGGVRNPMKHWKKKVVREETVFKHIATTTYCRPCSSLLRCSSWRGHCVRRPI